jgi:hypothetical protein
MFNPVEYVLGEKGCFLGECLHAVNPQPSDLKPFWLPAL